MNVYDMINNEEKLYRTFLFLIGFLEVFKIIFMSMGFSHLQ